ncbi:MAG: ABC transporter ATP-binding protein [Solirubrobacteraceae bacterium]
MSICCRDLFKVHRTPEGDAAALQGLTLDAEPGEMLAVLGPSGSGKSTLLRILAGLERPSAGSALVAGQDMARLGARARAVARRDLVAVVGQHAERELAPALTLAESVALPLLLRGASRAPARATAHELLTRVGLGDRATARPHELSGGERQRAALCAAVAHRPPVVLADEPTGELDARAATEVLTLLAGLAAQDGATVLVVTHDAVSADTADRTVRIRDGRVSQEGRAEGLAVVIGRGGWLHVPEDVLASAGIADRATVRAEAGAVILEPAAGGAAAQDTPAVVAVEPPPAVPGVPARVEGLRMSFGERAVFTGLGTAFDPGTLTAVTGRSGSGKSTLLRLLAGLARPDGGRVVIGDQALDGLDREGLAALRARHVGVVGQDPQLLSFLTAAEQVALAAPDQHAARAWLAAVGLAERAGQRVGRLSAGERQRVAIARALAGGRGLLLVDEPTSRLDEANAVAIAGLLRSAAHDHGATVVCATHDTVVSAAADRTLALDPAAAPADSG